MLLLCDWGHMAEWGQLKAAEDGGGAAPDAVDALRAECAALAAKLESESGVVLLHGVSALGIRDYGLQRPQWRRRVRASARTARHAKRGMRSFETCARCAATGGRALS